MRLKMRDASGYPGGVFDSNPSYRGVFQHHIPAVFCRYSKRISLQVVKIDWQAPLNRHWSNALYGEHLEEISLNGFRGAPAVPDRAAVELRHAARVSIENSKVEPGTGTFLLLDEVKPNGLFVVGNDLQQAKVAVRFADGTSPAFFAAANRMPNTIEAEGEQSNVLDH